MTEKNYASQFDHTFWKYGLVNTVAAEFNNIVGQLTELSQCLKDKWLKCLNISAKKTALLPTALCYRAITHRVLIICCAQSNSSFLSPCIPLVQLRCRALQRQNSPADWAREMFKPSTDSASLPVRQKKNFFRFGFGILWVTPQWGHVFACLAKCTWPWLPTQRAIFWLKIFLETTP